MLSIPSELARSALDAAPDAMLIIDHAGIIQYANQQVSSLFGYAHAEVVGQSVERLMPDRFRTQHIAHRQHYSGVRRPMGQGLELIGRRADGTEFPVEISLGPVESPGQSLVAAAIRDVTDRKRAEAELKVARHTADRALETATEARESADRANQSKSRFLATASHDLRQPLQTLALLNGTLRRIVSNRDAAEVLAQQEQAIGAMSRLLNALLDISKLESGAIKLEPCDFKVAALLEELHREFAGIAASKGLKLQVAAAEQYVYSDRSLVERILKNLVSNAIKYTRQGQVSLRCVSEAASVRVEILDTGIGIPSDQIAYIYDEFYQVGVPANSSREGYGLGLSIVKRLVRLLNLRLDVTSEVGKGSVFSLSLQPGTSGPAAAPADTSRDVPRELRTDRPRVLLVEDDRSVRDATRMLLKVEGYDVTAVASLAEALRNVNEQGTPDLLITDYHLQGGESGTQVIAQVRENSGVLVKAVLITGDTSTAVKELPPDSKLRVISKPVNAEELLNLMSCLLAS